MGEATIGTKGKSTSQTNYNQQQQTAPAQWVGQALPSVYGQAQAAPSEYTLPAQPVAGFTPDQLAAMQGVRDIQGSADPYFALASQYGQQGAGPLNIDQYLNPYIDYVTKNLQDIFGQQMHDVTGRLTQAAGGVGADRIAVGQANLAKQQDLAAGQTYANIYNQAAGLAQNEAQRQLQASGLFGQLAPSVQQTGLEGLQALLRTGGMQQQLTQAQQQALYNLLQSQFGFGFQRPQYEAGILGALGPLAGGTTTGQGTSTTTATPPQPSALSQALGAGLGVAGLIGGGGLGGLAGGLGKGGLGAGVLGSAPSLVGKGSGGAVPRRQLGGPTSLLQNSVVPQMPLQPGRPNFPRLDLSLLRHARMPEQRQPTALDYLGTGNRLGKAFMPNRPTLPTAGNFSSMAFPAMPEAEEAAGGAVYEPYRGYQEGGSTGGKGSLPGGFSGMGTNPANTPGVPGTGATPFANTQQPGQFQNWQPGQLMQNWQQNWQPGQWMQNWRQNHPNWGQGGQGRDNPMQAQIQQIISQLKAGGQPTPEAMQAAMAQIKALFPNMPSQISQAFPQINQNMPPGMPPQFSNMISAFQPLLNQNTPGAFQGMQAHGGAVSRQTGGPTFSPFDSFEERFPQSNIFTGSRNLAAALRAKAPEFRQINALRRLFEASRQAGGGVDDDEPLYKDDPINLSGTVDWGERKDAPERVLAGKPAVTSDDEEQPYQSVIPAYAKVTEVADTSPRRSSNFPPTQDPFGPYPGPTEMPRGRMPYPDALQRGAGEDFTRSPWSALARAGFSIMGGKSPWAGINIGQGALEGIKGLEEQRATKMKEEEVNQSAQRLWQQMQQHADQYRYMTPAQKLNAIQQERLYQKQIQQLELEGLKPFQIGSDFDEDTGLERKIYGIRDPRTREIVPIDPKTGRPAAAAPTEPTTEEKRAPLVDEFKKRDETEPDPLGAKELRPDLVPSVSKVQGPAKGPFATQAAGTKKLVDASMEKKRGALEVQRDQITRLKQDYATVMADNEKDGFFTKILTLPGADPEQRIEAAKKANLVAMAAGKPPVFNPAKVAAIEEAIKIQRTMGMSFAATISPRDAMQMQLAAISAQPGFTQSPAGMLRLIGLYDGLTTHGENEQKYWGRWKQVNPRTSAGWEEDFRDKNPSDRTTVRAMLNNIPSQEAKRRLPEAIEYLRAHKDDPEALRKFDQIYSGTSSFFLTGKFDPYAGLR